MNKHFEKLLLVSAIVICAIGFGYAYQLHIAQKKQASVFQAGGQPSGKEYQRVTLPAAAVVATSWGVPVRRIGEGDEQEPSLWAYDLFTPVEIRWDSFSGEYAPKGLPPEAEAPFGIKLVALTHPVYRLSLQTYILPPSKKFEESEIRLNDAERKTYYSVKKGGVLRTDGIDIKVLDFKAEKVAEGSARARIEETVLIFDNKRQREFRITSEPLVFTEVTDLVLARTESPSQTWTLHKEGDRIEVDGIGKFTIKGIDFDAKTVIVEKSYKPVTRRNAVTQLTTLQIESAGQTATTPKLGATTTTP